MKTVVVLVFLTCLSLLSVGCKTNAERARLMLNQAQTLLREEKPIEARKLLLDVVARYGETKEATEANQILMGMKLAENAADAKAAVTIEEILMTALGSFRLDCGRYPTDGEGLDALFQNPGIKGWSGPYIPHDLSQHRERFNISYIASSGQEPRVKVTKKDLTNRGDASPPIRMRGDAHLAALVSISRNLSP